MLAIILLSLVFGDSGCTPQTNQPTNQGSEPYPFINDQEKTDEVGEGDQPYPFQSTSPDPEATNKPELFGNIPTPSPDTGIVLGTLLQLGNNKDPYIAELFLGRAIDAQQPGYEPMIGFSRETDPGAVQNQNTGEFYFLEVPSGKYALIAWSPLTSFIFKNETSGEFLILEVEPGKVLDLGELRMP